VSRCPDDARTFALRWVVACHIRALVKPSAAAAAPSDTLLLAPLRAAPIDRMNVSMFERIALDSLLGKARTCLASVLPLFLLGCTSTPPPRPAALDPSNPNNAESPPIAGASASAPEPAPDVTHEHHHGSSSGMDMNMSSGGMNLPSGPTPGGDGGSPTSSATDGGAAVYTCPMHPDVRQPGPGRCPKCGMTLVPGAPGAPTPSTNHMTMDGGM
jgi:hypothetical protein